MEYRDPNEIRTFRAGGRERLERLADLLEDMATDAWVSAGLDMNDWCRCGVGLAAHHPWFQAQGLTLNRAGGVVLDGHLLIGAHGFAPVARFFGLTHHDARHLFVGLGTPHTVVRRLRKLLAGFPT